MSQSQIEKPIRLRRATVSFVMYVRQSDRPFICMCMEKLGSHWKDFREILHKKIFKKSVERIQGSFKSDKRNRYFT